MSQRDTAISEWQELAKEAAECNAFDAVPTTDTMTRLCKFGELAADRQTAHQSLTSHIARIALQRVLAGDFECRCIPWTFHKLIQRGRFARQVIQPMPLPAGDEDTITFNIMDDPPAQVRGWGTTMLYQRARRRVVHTTGRNRHSNNTENRG